MSDGTSAAVDRYFAIWNETDAQRRRELISRTWSEEATYLDPMFSAEGHEGIDLMVASVHEQYPRHEFRLVGAIDNHHDCLMFSWEVVNLDTAARILAGIDFAVRTVDGRLGQVTGFFD
jgi:hypothetical protein